MQEEECQGGVRAGCFIKGVELRVIVSQVRPHTPDEGE